MKTAIKTMTLAAVLTLAWGCSSSDDDEKNVPAYNNTTFEAFDRIPQWEVDQKADQQRPQWTSPDPSRYENKMIVMLRLQDELVPYSTDEDLMAVMEGDDCRALSTRSGSEDKVFFVINVHGNSTAEANDYRLCYYSGGLKQLFVLQTPENSFLNERNLGIDSDFSPALTEGSTKYPVKTTVTVHPGLIDNRAIDTEYDLIGVFVNGECRGVGYPSYPFTVFSYSNEEQGELRFFSWMQQGIYTSNKKLTLTGEPQTIVFDF